MKKWFKGSQYDSALGFKFVFPILLENIFTTLISLVVTQTFSTISNSALTAITISNQYLTVLNAGFFLFVYSALVFAAREVGSKNWAGAKEAAEQTILYAFLFSVVLVLVCEVTADFVLKVFMPTDDAQLLKEAVRYFRILIISFIPATLTSVSINVFRAVGDTTKSMISNIMVSLALLLFAFLFVRIFHLEEIGAGWAYVIARTIGASYIMFRLFFKNKVLPLSFGNLFKPKKGYLKRIMKLGLAICFDNVSIQLVYLLAGSAAVYLGATDATAYSIIWTLTSSTSFTLNSIYNSISLTAHSHLLGAGKFEDSKKVSYRLIVSCILVTALVNGVIVLFAMPLSKLYSNDFSAIEIAAKNMWILLPMNIAGTLLNVVTPKLTAAGDTKFIMANSMVSVWIIRMPLIYLFLFVVPIGVLGLYLANAISLIVRLTVLCIRLGSNKWFHEV